MNIIQVCTIKKIQCNDQQIKVTTLLQSLFLQPLDFLLLL